MGKRREPGVLGGLVRQCGRHVRRGRREVVRRDSGAGRGARACCLLIVSAARLRREGLGGVYTHPERRGSA
eukprot:2478180-Prymnesium_polylepis.1